MLQLHLQDFLYLVPGTGILQSMFWTSRDDRLFFVLPPGACLLGFHFVEESSALSHLASFHRFVATKLTTHALTTAKRQSETQQLVHSEPLMSNGYTAVNL